MMARLAGGDERIDAAVGLGQAEHADQGAPIGRVVYRRRHVHHGIAFFAWYFRAGAGAVLATQGAVDIVSSANCHARGSRPSES